MPAVRTRPHTSTPSPHPQIVFYTETVWTLKHMVAPSGRTSIRDGAKHPHPAAPPATDGNLRKVRPRTVSRVARRRAVGARRLTGHLPRSRPSPVAHATWPQAHRPPPLAFPPPPPAHATRAPACHRASGLAPPPRLRAPSAPLEARDVLGAVALGDGDGDARQLVLEEHLVRVRVRVRALGLGLGFGFEFG